MYDLWFDNWQSLARTAILTCLAYVALVILLRISKKRTLSKMNAFDFIVTIALGSTLASVALSRSIPLSNGILALALLVGLQWLVSWISVRSPAFKHIVTAQPSLLLHKGQVLTAVCRSQRITIEELRLAARESGIGDLAEVDAMILETTGSITVIEHLDETRRASALAEVEAPAS